MNRQDQDKARALAECATTLGQTLAPERISSYVRLLADVPPADLRAALDRHLRDPRRGAFFPAPAEILAKLPRPFSGHPPADAAWAVALRSLDERTTVVWTAEIAAARSAALPVWETGDKIGARMAFRAAYEAIVQQAGESPPRWAVSAGHDPAQRAAAVQDAQSAGLLSHDQAQALLPAPGGETDPGIAQVAGLLAGKGGSNVIPLQGGSERVRRFRAAVAAGMRLAGQERLTGQQEADMAQRKAAAQAQADREAQLDRLRAMAADRGQDLDAGMDRLKK